jgi:hypothetical protein
MPAQGVAVTEQDREPAGDYGYDMAHEDMAHGRSRRAPAPDHPKAQPHATVHAGGNSDQGEDYGYDEAHGF